jgi:hypothetical protein
MVAGAATLQQLFARPLAHPAGVLPLAQCRVAECGLVHVFPHDEHAIAQMGGRCPAVVSYPGSKKHRTEASILVPRMFNHTHSNNMIDR